MVKSKISLVLIIVFSVFVCVLIGGYVTLKIFTSDNAIKRINIINGKGKCLDCDTTFDIINIYDSSAYFSFMSS